MDKQERSVSLSQTVCDRLNGLVGSGEYVCIDDAATDLLMQSLRNGKPLSTPQIETVYPSGEPTIETVTDDDDDDYSQLIDFKNG